MAKTKATSIYNHAKRKDYGAGECGYYFSSNDEENKENIADFPEFYKQLLSLSEAYFESMMELDNL